MQKFLTLAAAAALSVAFTATEADAALFNFQFDNEDGPIAGSVIGTIELPDGDGTFAATSILITSAPGGLGYDPSSIDWALAPSGIFENMFTVTGGNITAGGYLGLFNGSTAFAIASSFVGGISFLDVLNGADFGATGVLDADSSTLTYPPLTAPIPVPATFVLAASGIAAMAVAARRRKG